jgi:phage terminase large subunit-like protein
VSAVSEALHLLMSLVLEDGRRWGEAAQPFPREDASAVLDLSGPPRHYLTRPRGGSKTTDLAGIGAVALLEEAPAGSRSYAFAADRDQSALLLDALAGFASRTPEIAGALRIDAARVANIRTGATLQVMASDDASAWGLRPYLTIVDELAQWPTTSGPRRLWRAIFSALPKVSNSRLVCLTSAGDPAHWSYGVLERALAQPDRWRVSQTPGPLSWIDPRDLEEQRHELPEWDFARLHLNQWTAADDRLTNVDDLRACVTLEGPLAPDPRWTYVVSADLSTKRDTTVVAVCHLEPIISEVTGASLGERMLLDRMVTWTPRGGQRVSLVEVEETIFQAARSFGAPLVVDPWQAVGMAQRLRERGVFVEEFVFSQSSVGRLALTLHNLIKEHALAIPDDAALIDELANVRLRESAPGVYRMDHDPDKHDDRAIALALAAQWLLSLPAPLPDQIFEAEDLWSDRDEYRYRVASGEHPLSVLLDLHEHGSGGPLAGAV